MNQYDYIICGAGPVGLTLAWLLAEVPQINKILIIDRESEIGGCHRVRRYNKLFTEHAPRIYSDSYLNFQQILNHMGLSFPDFFTPYQIADSNQELLTVTNKEVLSIMSFREILLLGIEYFKLIVNPHHGINETVLQFTERNNFSKTSQEQLNRICRLTDGAGADRYTMLELLSILDQHIFYKIFQPKRPNDRALFPEWQDKLKGTGKITLMLDTTVENLLYSKNQIQGVVVQNNQGQFNIQSPNVILAIPPKNAIGLINKIGWGTHNLTSFAENSKYDPFLPIVFHWDKELNLPRIWGFSNTEWGVLSIKLSDYMDFDDPRSKTVISSSISMPDIVSSNTGKTANQSDKGELIHETFQQLSKFYGGLPPPTHSILSPGVYRSNEENPHWTTLDNSFVLTPKSKFIPEQNHPTIQGLSWVGTHNGYSHYNFTSMESAITNALAYYFQKFPELASQNYQLKQVTSLSEVLRKVLIAIVIILVIYLVYSNWNSNFKFNFKSNFKQITKQLQKFFLR